MKNDRSSYCTILFANINAWLSNMSFCVQTMVIGPLLFICFWSCDAGCATSVSPESLTRQLQGKTDMVLVDVRDPDDFQKCHIPNALSIRLFALKTKMFLKSKPLVLIDEGHSYRRLLDEAETLTKTGYDISLLDGGLYQWRRVGLPTEGTAFARDLPTISVQAFLAGRGSENWLVVDVRQSGKPTTEDKDLRQVRLPFQSGPKFAERLNSVIAGHKQREFLTVIVCDENGTRYQEIEKLVQAEGVRAFTKNNS